MYKLSKIILTNWYLFEREEIDIEGSTVFIGENAAGKSTILDAIQIVLTGNNARWQNLNAQSQAGQKATRTTRSVYDYCLGLVGDRAEGATPVRDTALTRIALVFSQPGETSYTLGAAFYADNGAEVKREQLDALFIIEGAVTSSDFVEDLDGGDWLDLDWSTIHERLKGQGKVVQVFDKSTKFVGEFLRLMNSQKGWVPSIEKFTKSFSNAVNLTLPANASEFVRQYLLDYQPLNLEKLRQSIRNYQQLKAMKDQLIRQTDLLKKVQRTVDRFDEATDNHRTATYLLGRCSLTMAERREESLTKAHSQTSVKYQDVKGYLVRLEEEIALLKTQLADARDRFMAAGGGQLDGQQQRVKMAEAAVSQGRFELEGFRTKIRDIAYVSAFVPDIRGLLGKHALVFREHDIGIALKELQHLEQDGGPIESWPQDTQAVAQTLSELLGLKDVEEELTEAYSVSAAELHTLRNREHDIKEEIKQIKERGSALDAHEERFLQAFVDFDAVPLCSLVDVNDERWRPVIETLLGNKRASLVIDPSKLDGALTYFKTVRREFRGMRLVNTSKPGRKPLPGSLATKVDTDNPFARAYIDKELGNILCVSDERELKSEGRAATDFGLYGDGASVTSLNLVSRHKLARSGIAAISLPPLEEELTEVQTSLTAARTATDKVDRIRKAVGSAALAVETILPAAEHCREGYEAAQRDLRTQLNILEQMGQKIDGALKQQVDDLALDIKERESAIVTPDPDHHNKTLKERVDILFRQLTIDENELGKARSNTERATEEFKAMCDGLGIAATTDEDEVHQRLDTVYQKQIESGKDVHIIFDTAKTLEATSTKSLQTLPYEVADQLKSFVIEFNLLSVYDPSKHEIGDHTRWVREQLKDLEHHKLPQYEDDILTSSNAIKTMMMNDFVLKLADRKDSIPRAIDAVNALLKGRIFHKNVYEFSYEQVPSKAGLLRFVSEVRRDQDKLGLLMEGDQSASPADQVHFDKIVQLIEGDMDLDEYEDIRKYFNFELKFKDLKGKLVGSLTSRSGSGSGGEKQAPYYVTTAAALASAYHGAVAARSFVKGMGVGIFDEAFNNLDSVNLGAMIDYFHKIGIQPIMAAPEKVRSEFLPHVDTVVEVSRPSPGDAVFLDVSSPGPKAKDALKQEDPRFQQSLNLENPDLENSPEETPPDE